MPVIMAVDYGRKRIGVAVSDPLGIAGTGLPTLTVSGRKDAVEQVAALAQDRAVDMILVGLPLNMDGSRGPMAEEASTFAHAVQEVTGLRVVPWDERLTTESARKAVAESGDGRRRTKGRLDQMAATLMLNDYLQSRPGEPDAG